FPFGSNRTNAIISSCWRTPRHRNAHAHQTGSSLLSCSLCFLSSWQQEFSLVSSSCARLCNYLGCIERSALEMLAVDRVNICASGFIGLLPTFAIFESHANSKLALLDWVGRQR